MKKTNLLLAIFIIFFVIVIIMISIYLKANAEYRLEATKDRTELININKEQLRLLKLERCE